MSADWTHNCVIYVAMQERFVAAAVRYAGAATICAFAMSDRRAADMRSRGILSISPAHGVCFIPAKEVICRM